MNNKLNGTHTKIKSNQVLKQYVLSQKDHSDKLTGSC